MNGLTIGVSQLGVEIKEETRMDEKNASVLCAPDDKNGQDGVTRRGFMRRLGFSLAVLGASGSLLHGVTGCKTDDSSYSNGYGDGGYGDSSSYSDVSYGDSSSYSEVYGDSGYDDSGYDDSSYSEAYKDEG